jgi:hypothetical protein
MCVLGHDVGEVSCRPHAYSKGISGHIIVFLTVTMTS